MVAEYISKYLKPIISFLCWQCLIYVESCVTVGPFVMYKNLGTYSHITIAFISHLKAKENKESHRLLQQQQPKKMIGSISALFENPLEKGSSNVLELQLHHLPINFLSLFPQSSK